MFHMKDMFEILFVGDGSSPDEGSLPLVYTITVASVVSTFHSEGSPTSSPSLQVNLFIQLSLKSFYHIYSPRGTH